VPKSQRRPLVLHALAILRNHQCKWRSHVDHRWKGFILELGFLAVPVQFTVVRLYQLQLRNICPEVVAQGRDDRAAFNEQAH